MNHELLQEQFFETLINGDRPASRTLVESALADATPERVISELFWPTYDLIERLFRNDQLTRMSHHLSTRLLRVLVDQMTARLERQGSNGRSILAFCGPSEGDELGAQMAVDILESRGYRVRFAGGGIANDEILAQVHETKPDILLMFAPAASDLPNIRALIDTLQEIGACPNIQFVVAAGVFNRAEGLAEEIGADLWASTPRELLDVLASEPQRRAELEQRTVGRKRRKKAA